MNKNLDTITLRDSKVSKEHSKSLKKDSSLKIRIYKEFSNDLKEKWEELEDKIPEKNIYFSFLWASTWWEVFGHKYELLILVAEDNEAVRGIAPLMISYPLGERMPRARNLLFIGTGLSDYHDILVEKGFEREVLTQILYYLKYRYKSWSLLRLRHFSEDSQIPAYLKNRIEQLNLDKNWKFFHRPTVKCPFIKVDSNWESYYKSVSRNLRSDANRKLNKLKKTFEFKFEKVEPRSPGEFKKYLNSFMDINRKRWVQKNERNIFSFNSVEHQQFYRAVTTKFSQRGLTLFYVLHLDGKPVAYIYCFKYNDKIYHWNTAFDPAYFRFSIGKVLHRLAIEDIFKSGYTELDFMRGDEEYKLKWTRKARVNSEIVLLNSNNILSRYFGFYYLIMKPYLENAGFVDFAYRNVKYFQFIGYILQRQIRKFGYRS